MSVVYNELERVSGRASDATTSGSPAIDTSASGCVLSGIGDRAAARSGAANAVSSDSDGDRDIIDEDVARVCEIDSLKLNVIIRAEGISQ